MVIASILLLAACDRPRAPEITDVTKKSAPHSLADPDFVRLFCSSLSEAQQPCQRWFTGDGVVVGLAGTEGQPLDLSPSRAVDKANLTTLIVSGLFSDCVSRWFTAFGSAQQQLVDHGYAIERVEIGGRLTSAANADLIRSAVKREAVRGRKVLLVGYSKGANDVLEAIRNADTARSVVGVVSLGGSVGGSELIEQLPAVLQRAIEQTPFPGCSAADSELFSTLSTAFRQDYLNQWQAPEDVVLFSVAGQPQPARVSRALTPLYRALRERGIANDGQVSVESTSIPSGRALARLNADHWAMALDIQGPQARLVSAVVDRNDFPRTALLRALIEMVAATVAQPRELATSAREGA